MAEFPGEGFVEVGEARGEGSADEVEGGGGVEVGLDEPRRVDGAFGDGVAVEDVAAEGRDGAPFVHFGGA